MFRLNLLRGKAVQQESSLLRSLTPVLDNNNTASNNLSSIALSVKLAQSSPLTELLGIRNLDQRNLLFGFVAQSLDQSNVRLLSDSIAENTDLGLSRRQGLGGFSQSSSKTIVDKSLLENSFKGVLERQRSRSDSLSGNFDFNGGFSIRLVRLGTNVTIN
jgi:hypothetical protein